VHADPVDLDTRDRSIELPWQRYQTDSSTYARAPQRQAPELKRRVELAAGLESSLNGLNQQW